MAEQLQREIFSVNGVIESEDQPVRVFGTIGLSPQTIDGRRVQVPAGSLWVEPKYDTPELDAYFHGYVQFDKTKPPTVAMDAHHLEAVLIGQYDGKGARCSVSVHADEKAMLIVIEPYAPLDRNGNMVIAPDQQFDPVRYDTQSSDFGTPTWESWKYGGLD